MAKKEKRELELTYLLADPHLGQVKPRMPIQIKGLRFPDTFSPADYFMFSVGAEVVQTEHEQYRRIKDVVRQITPEEASRPELENFPVRCLTYVLEKSFYVGENWNVK